MGKQEDLSVKYTPAADGIGGTIEAMYRGMEGLLQSKTVVGEPIEVGDLKLIPLVEVSAGMAGGSFAENAKKRGAGAMTAKMSPVALLAVEGDRVRLINVRNQDAAAKLIDLIPDAVDRIVGDRVSPAAVEKAKELAEKLGFRKGQPGDAEAADGENAGEAAKGADIAESAETAVSAGKEAGEKMHE